VVSDNRAGAISAVNHLLAVGHRRIGYLGDRMSIATAVQRYQGYTHALELARIPLDERIVWHGPSSEEAGMEATTRMLRLPDPPTALFTGQNLLTSGACRALRVLGIENAVAMVGFDDFPLADILRPGITVIAQDVAETGRLAVEILFRRLDGDRSPFKTHVLPTWLITRGSGEIGPAPA
jgi:LacI family transcriptional regulator